jgi:hypothetical protein
MQTDRTIPVENTDPDQMDTLEDNILSDQMDISDDDQMDWQVVEPLAPGMTNLQVAVLRSVIDDQKVGETKVIRFRCVSKRIEKFGGSHQWKVKRQWTYLMTIRWTGK